MKALKYLITFIGTLLFLSFVLISCRSTKIAAVSCPEFSENKSNKVTEYNKRNRNKVITSHCKVNIKKQPVDQFAGLSRKNRVKDIVVFNNSQVKKKGTISELERISGLSKIEYSHGLTASIEEPIIPFERNNITAHSLKKVDMTEQPEDIIITQPEVCDTIVLKSGSVVIGKVAEIGQNEIKYRRCDNLNGPIISISESDVSVIKYPNGTRDFFTSKNTVAFSDSNATKETDVFGIIGLVFSLAGLFLINFTGLIGVILGIISLHRIIKHPDKFKGKGIAKASIIVGIIGFVLSMILFKAVYSI